MDGGNNLAETMVLTRLKEHIIVIALQCLHYAAFQSTRLSYTNLFVIVT